ncbi:MAG: hypothetical protein WCE70_04665, partial [Rhodanobacteraceae bacterium]
VESGVDGLHATTAKPINAAMVNGRRAIGRMAGSLGWLEDQAHHWRCGRAKSALRRCSRRQR